MWMLKSINWGCVLKVKEMSTRKRSDDGMEIHIITHMRIHCKNGQLQFRSSNSPISSKFPTNHATTKGASNYSMLLLLFGSLMNFMNNWDISYQSTKVVIMKQVCLLSYPTYTLFMIHTKCAFFTLICLNEKLEPWLDHYNQVVCKLPVYQYCQGPVHSCHNFYPT